MEVPQAGLPSSCHLEDPALAASSAILGKMRSKETLYACVVLGIQAAPKSLQVVGEVAQFLFGVGGLVFDEPLSHGEVCVCSFPRKFAIGTVIRIKLKMGLHHPQYQFPVNQNL
jgi:hypothetical protein